MLHTAILIQERREGMNVKVRAEVSQEDTFRFFFSSDFLVLGCEMSCVGTAVNNATAAHPFSVWSSTEQAMEKYTALTPCTGQSQWVGSVSVGGVS